MLVAAFFDPRYKGICDLNIFTDLPLFSEDEIKIVNDRVRAEYSVFAEPPTQHEQPSEDDLKEFARLGLLVLFTDNRH